MSGGFAAVPAQLRAVLACPRCKQQQLEWREAQGEIECRPCQLVYAIQEGVPVMLVELARPAASQTTPPGDAP